MREVPQQIAQWLAIPTCNRHMSQVIVVWSGLPLLLIH